MRKELILKDDIKNQKMEFVKHLSGKQNNQEIEKTPFREKKISNHINNNFNTYNINNIFKNVIPTNKEKREKKKYFYKKENSKEKKKEIKQKPKIQISNTKKLKKTKSNEKLNLINEKNPLRNYKSIPHLKSSKRSIKPKPSTRKIESLKPKNNEKKENFCQRIKNIKFSEFPKKCLKKSSKKILENSQNKKKCFFLVKKKQIKLKPEKKKQKKKKKIN